MEAPDWSEAETQIRMLLGHFRCRISNDANNAVEHYLSHAEYEMALEGLLLEIMAVRPIDVQVDWPCYVRLARQLRLDVESVFEGAFWERFTTFLSAGRDDAYR